METTYFRRGFGRKKQIEPLIEAEFHSALVEEIRAHGYTRTFGEGPDRVTIRLAEEFGFCYGVDRAVDYAYETRIHFPERRILLVGEIIHNPHVNRRLQEMGIVFLYPGPDGVFDFGGIGPDDVVILPAFGVTIGDFGRLRETGCILVDTTCGSVLNVWKRVEQYARDGFTALIHGKHHHEETQATASQAFKYPDGHYLIVRHMEEARRVMD
jgi:4-hydroxy-3-methylbut-2-enyl diphosphate reductase